jgi:hypothetical protein
MPTEHELDIITNDGWVVALVSDKPIIIGDVNIRTIIVQPREDFDKRAATDTAGTQRSQYSLRKS